MLLENVFGISKDVNDASYVDRANLDMKVKRLLNRNMHIALKGASKSGKSWLRQQSILNANVVQCRLNKSIQEVYVEALANLGVKLELEHESTNSIKGTLEASGEVGSSLLAKVVSKLGIGLESGERTKERDLKYDLNNLKFIADLIIESGRKLVIEDFHYLSVENRKQFAYDLKTLWDYGCFVVVIGVWTQSNMLIYLNPDLSGRIEEISVLWNQNDLRKVLEKGCEKLNVTLDNIIMENLVNDSFGNVGILQTLTYNLMEKESIYESCGLRQRITKVQSYEDAARAYANQLDGLYQQYAKVLSNGIRQRGDSTGIYAYTMKAIVEASDDKLQNGFTRDEIYVITNAWESRIQKGNLGTILRKLEELQIDSEYKGLVIGYDESTESVFVVDRQLLFYRKHHVMKWPWEELAEESRNQQDTENCS